MVFVELNPLTISVSFYLLRVPYRRCRTPRRNRAANGTEPALSELKAHTASEQLETNGYRVRVFIRNRVYPPVDGPRRSETAKKREIRRGEGHAAAGFVPTS